MRILVSGRVVGAAGHGGAAWAVLSWALGARALGHEVCLSEPLDAPTANQRSYAAAVEQASGIRPCLLGRGDDVPAADVLINLSGVLPAQRAIHVRHRIYVDVDPGFTQAWALAGEDLGLAGHTAYATVGLSVGSPGCLVPDLGLTWLPTMPPVDLHAWTATDTPARHPATTVANWRSYGTASLDGVALGQRAHTMRNLLDLPSRSAVPLRPALAIDPGEHADLDRLRAAGWQWSDPSLLAADPNAYRRYVRDSRLELGFAKAGYVDTRSGWFSDRTAAYLASGRPAVVTDTGLPGSLLTGEGLLTYRTSDDAVAALDHVVRAEQSHARAARAFAERHLDAAHVVADLLERAC